jgi:hypothetical protein
LGRIMINFFHRRIWSPCSQPTIPIGRCSSRRATNRAMATFNLWHKKVQLYNRGVLNTLPILTHACFILISC